MRILLTLIIVFCLHACYCQDTHSVFDQSLADSLGADEYGMKMYTFVLLQTGKTQIADRDSLKILMRGHLANISRLADAGEIILAGPYGKNDLEYRGLFVFSSPDNSKVRKLLFSDPAISIGLFDPVLIPWYGSAAIPMYMQYHTRIEKVKP